MKLIISILAILLAALTNPADALEYSQGYSGGNCSTCSWIAADGEIKQGDASGLLKFIAAEDIEYQKLIIINSPGGNVAAAIKLGMLLRKRGMRVIVGKTKQGEVEYADRPIQFYDAGLCASACVFVLMGGIEREIAEGSQVGVHQFAPSADEIASIASTTSSTQSIMAELQGYAIQMGVNPGVLTLASSTTPENMMWLDPRNMEQLNLLTSRNYKSMAEWSLRPARSQLLARAAQVQTNGRTTVYVADCRYLHVGFEVASSRIQAIAGSIMSASLRAETSLSSYPLKIADISVKDQMIMVSLVAGPAVLNVVAQSANKLMLVIDLPHAYEDEFGGSWHIIPSTNMAEISPHVVSSCR